MHFKGEGRHAYVILHVFYGKYKKEVNDGRGGGGK